MNRIAVFFVEGYEEIEALTVVDLCRRAGLTVTMVSVTGADRVTGSHGICVMMDAKIEDLIFTEYDMLVLPGGMPGTKNLEACSLLMTQLDDFYKQGKRIAAICAAPSIFGHRGYLKGRRATAYPSFTKELDGAYAVDMPAVTDGHVITGQGMGAAIPFALQIVAQLLSKEEAKKLAESIVWGNQDF